MEATEKKVSFTPGPWRTSGTYAMVETDALKICEVHVNEGMSEDDFTFEQWRANARLIAAAPELLEELQKAKNFLSAYIKSSPFTSSDWLGGMKAGIEAMESVIAKATTTPLTNENLF